MGRDVTYHPLSRQDLEALYELPLANPDTVPGVIESLVKSRAKRRHLERIYAALWAPDAGVERAFIAACLAGYRHPYWYARGSSLELLVERAPALPLVHLSDVVGPPAGSGEGAYIPADHVAAWLGFLADPLNAAAIDDALGGPGPLEHALRYARDHEAGVLEAVDVMVPISGACSSDHDNLRAEYLGNEHVHERAPDAPAPSEIEEDAPDEGPPALELRALHPAGPAGAWLGEVSRVLVPAAGGRGLRCIQFLGETRVVLATERAVEVRDLTDGTLGAHRTMTGYPSSVAWLSDDTIACAGSWEGVVFFDHALEPVGQLPADTVLGGHVAAPPDGRRLATLERKHSVLVLDTADFRGGPIPTGELAMQVFAWSRDGRKLAAGGQYEWLGVLDVDGQGDVWFEAPRGALRAVAMSPDGARLVSSGEASILVVWDAARGRITHAITGLMGSCGLDFSPDGALLAAIDRAGVLRLWSWPELEALGAIATDHVRIAQLKFAPDGRHFITGGEEGSVRVWDLWKTREVL